MKRNGTNRVLIPGDGHDKVAIASAFKLGIELSRKVSRNIDDVVLLIPTKKSIRQESLQSVVSERIAKLLEKGGEIPLADGVRLRTETPRTYKPADRKDIVIAVHADTRMMGKVDRMAGLHTIIGVEQKEGALAGWAEKWSPLIPGTGKGAGKQVISDPVVETALSALTTSIDLSEKALSPRDKKQADIMARILRRNKHQEKPADICAWAVGHGWPKKAADELKKTWKKVYSLKSMPRVKDAAMARQMYEGWV